MIVVKEEQGGDWTRLDPVVEGGGGGDFGRPPPAMNKDDDQDHHQQQDFHNNNNSSNHHNHNHGPNPVGSIHMSSSNSVCNNLCHGKCMCTVLHFTLINNE